MNSRAILLTTALTFAAALPAWSEGPNLTVLDWTSFEADGLHTAYIAKYGAPPAFSFFADDDEAFQKVSSGFKPDVVHPCSQMVGKYREAGVIEPWDTSKITAYADLDPAFLASPVIKDDSGTWFLPTDWAATAMAYNSDEVPAEDVASLQIFTDPKYEGRVSIADNVDDAWALALLATGVSDWTNLTEEQFAAGAAWMRKAHGNVRAYWADPSELAQLMASGEVLIAWSWPDTVTQMRSDGYNIGFQREAKEGSSAFLCGYVNLKDAPGSEEQAYDFMNSWYEDTSSATLLADIGYASANLASMKQFPAEVLEKAGLGPISVPVLNQLPLDIAMRTRMQEEFEKVKAGF